MLCYGLDVVSSTAFWAEDLLFYVERCWEAVMQDNQIIRLQASEGIIHLFPGTVGVVVTDHLTPPCSLALSLTR